MGPDLISCLASFAVLVAAAGPAATQAGPVQFARRSMFTAPFQPWASPDGRVHLLRPAIAPPTTSDRPLGAMMSSGWRMIWDGSATTPGRMVVRLTLKVAPQPPEKTAREVLQVGISRSAKDVRSCLAYGLQGGSARRMPDRLINGRRYVVWTNGDAGMSQQVSATDLRAVVDGACYAVDRFSYAESASDGDPSVTLRQAQAAAALDRSLASLQLGPTRPDQVLQPQSIHPLAGAVAR